MPSKPPPRIENPISDSDSDSTTEEFEEEEEEDEEEDEEEEEEEIEDTPENENLQILLRTPLQNPNSKSNANSNPPQNAASNPSSDSSEEEEEEGSESDGSGSDSDSPARNRAPTTPAPKVKPVSSKPMNQTPKTPSASASSGSVKRRLETEEKSSKKEPKKKKKKEVSELGAGEDEPAKKPAAKVWSEEEEIIILKGMVNFRRRGKGPSHVAAFFDTIKHLLDPDINKIQLQGKLRTLKGKYETNAERVEVPGEDPEFVKQHDAEVYKLSKKVWGPGGSKVNVREPIRLVTNKLCSEKSESESESKEAKSPDNCRVANKKQASAVNEKQKQAPVANGKQTSTVNEKLDSESISEYTLLNASILPQDLPTAPPGLGEVFQKGGWNLMGASTAARLDKRWKNVIIAEAKAYLERIDLVKEQTQEMLDLLQSTDI